MKKNMTLTAAVLAVLCLLGGCHMKKNTNKPVAGAVPTAAAQTPAGSAITPAAPSQTPFEKEEKPTPTPLMDTDQMIADAEEKLDEITDGDILENKDKTAWDEPENDMEDDRVIG